MRLPRPPRRRRDIPDWPDYGIRRRRLSRGSVVLGALILILVMVFAQLAPEREAPPLPPPTASSGTGNGAATASAGTTGPLAIVELEGGWFASTLLLTRGDATRVAVERVIDGDTVDVRASTEVLRVRFYGINTTERGEACFSEATTRARELLGREVLLVPDARLQDRNGRELRYVFSLDGRSIDATLVAEGLARAWREDGVLRDRLVAIEAAAQRAKRGCLWRDS
jgi:micrococcal nuclease